MRISTWKKKLGQPEIFFPLIILVVGIISIIITPLGANFDEETYIARIFEMATGHIMPNSFIGSGDNYPLVLLSDSYRQDVNLWPVDGPTLLDQAKDKINWNSANSGSLINYKTRAVYFPTLFVLQAILMRIMGIWFNFPIIIIYFTIRFSYLLTYVILVYLALRIIPFGKWVLGAIAVGPMALITASSVSPDPIIFGICFLFAAWILHLVDQSAILISRKQLLITCGLILAICTLKPNYIFLLFLLFALPGQGFLKKKDIIVLVFVCLVGVGISLGWTYLASSVYFNQLNIPNDSAPRFWSLFQTPGVFIKSLVQTLARNTNIYLIETIGTTGYAYWRLPGFVYFLYPLTILLTFFVEENHNFLTTKRRLIFFLTGWLNILVIFILFFVSNTPLTSPTILGVSGRYFIPFILFLLLPLVFVKHIRFIKPIAITLIELIFISSTVTFFIDFHIMCGETLITHKTCKLPYYKNWGPETFIAEELSQGDALSQNIIVDCHTVSHVELWPMKNDLTDEDELILNLRSGSGELLSTASFSPVGIQVNQWYSVDIPDIVGMKGSAITIEIIPAEGDDLSKFSLGVFPTNEYTKGELFIKDGATGKSSTADNDLIFKYQCEKP